MHDVETVRAVKRAIEQEWLKKPGVTGMGVGYKYVGGRKTNEVAIRFFVARKGEVPAEQRVPSQVSGIETDVVERRFLPKVLRVPISDYKVRADEERYDPLLGGISIGPCRVFSGFVYVGTLGAITLNRKTCKSMLLTNYHVVCPENDCTVGENMAQPSPADGGECPEDIVGQIAAGYIGGEVDCAVVRQTDGGYVCRIVDIGPVTGTAVATLGMEVRKRGRTSGLTYGMVEEIDDTFDIDYGPGLGTIRLTSQIGIQADRTKSIVFGSPGDSGSVVVNRNNEVVGLYCCGSEDDIFGGANPIQPVLGILKVDMCQGRPEAISPPDSTGTIG